MVSTMTLPSKPSIIPLGRFTHLFTSDFEAQLFADVYDATGSVSEAKEAVRVAKMFKRQVRKPRC